MAFKKIMQLLFTPDKSLDEENSRRARLLVALLITLMIGLIIWNIFNDPRILSLPNRLLIDGLSVVWLSIVWLLARTNRIKAASILSIIGFFITVLASTLIDNGVQSPAFAGLAIITIIGGLLLGEKAILFGSAATIITGLGLALISTTTNWLHPGSSPFSAWLSHSIYIIITAVMATLSIQSTNEALDRARKELHERILTEKELVKFRKGIEQSEEAIFMTDRDGKIIYANPAFQKTYGYTLDQVINQNPRIIKSGLTPPEVYEQFWKTILAKVVVPVQFINKHKDGHLVMVEGSASPITNDQGEITGFLAIQHDVTARVKAEQALQESTEKIQAMFTSITDGITFTDLQGVIVDLNDATLRMHGYASKDELIGKNASVFLKETEIEFAYENMRRTMQVGDSGLVEYKFRRKDDSIFDGELKASLLKDRSGKPVGMVALTRDISQRKAADQALRDSEERFRSFVEETSDAVSIVDETGMVIEWNRSAERISGLSKAEVINRPIWDILFRAVAPAHKTPERYQSLKDRYIHALEKGELPWHDRPTTIEFMHADGSHRYGEQASFMMKTDRGYRIGNVLTDITDRKMAELQVEQQIRRLTELHMIDNAITSGVELDQILKIIMQLIRDELKVDSTGILLLNKESKTLDVVAVSGFQDDKWANGARLDLNTSFAGRAAREERILIASIHDQPDVGFPFWNLLESEQFHTIIIAPLINKHQVVGVVEVFIRQPFEPSVEWTNFLETLATQTAIAIDNRTLFDDLQRMNSELERSYDVTLEGWSRALDLRDEETEGHTRRVMEMTFCLARSIGFSEPEMINIRRGALLHDIGKMGVPDKILNKPGPLDDAEWAVMKQHPEFAYRLLSPVAHLRGALDIPYCHHERWDGTGYPRGLQGQEIPLVARVFAVADVWDALTSDRCYRPAWTEEKALKYIRQESGKHFDPEVVEVFLRVINGECKPCCQNKS